MIPIAETLSYPGSLYLNQGSFATPACAHLGRFIAPLKSPPVLPGSPGGSSVGHSLTPSGTPAGQAPSPAEQPAVPVPRC